MNRRVASVGNAVGVVLRGGEQSGDLGVPVVLDRKKELVAWHDRSENIADFAVEQEIEHGSVHFRQSEKEGESRTTNDRKKMKRNLASCKMGNAS